MKHAMYLVILSARVSPRSALIVLLLLLLLLQRLH
jgi:hypothetical protein